MNRRPPRSTPFPYTTLFRSEKGCVAVAWQHQHREALRLERLVAGEPRQVGTDREQQHVDADLPWLTGYERSEEHTSELQSQSNLVCRLLLEKKNTQLCAYSHLEATSFMRVESTFVGSTMSTPDISLSRSPRHPGLIDISGRRVGGVAIYW